MAHPELSTYTLVYYIGACNTKSPGWDHEPQGILKVSGKGIQRYIDGQTPFAIETTCDY